MISFENEDNLPNIPKYYLFENSCSNFLKIIYNCIELKGNMFVEPEESSYCFSFFNLNYFWSWQSFLVSFILKLHTYANHICLVRLERFCFYISLVTVKKMIFSFKVKISYFSFQCRFQFQFSSLVCSLDL